MGKSQSRTHICSDLPPPKSQGVFPAMGMEWKMEKKAGMVRYHPVEEAQWAALDCQGSDERTPAQLQHSISEEAPWALLFNHSDKPQQILQGVH